MNAVYVATLIAVTFIAALVSFHVFERRFLDLKRWFVPSSAARKVDQPRLVVGTSSFVMRATDDRRRATRKTVDRRRTSLGPPEALAGE
jgi:hypothetical protein